MNQKSNVYLSIGSNLGDKLENLQITINAIAAKIGEVSKISSIYETPSWGFKGNEFYNICILLKTTLTPLELLHKLQDLETKLGRTTKTTHEYQNRKIDIDIVLFDQQKIKSETLTIPHPRAQERKFVLVPLLDIFQEEHFPFENNTILESINNCIDKSPIRKTENKLEIPRNTSDSKYLI